ncbi:hypothetical protein Q31a_18090 [Aureliella helgolandensis]|uniref:Uncharacterized protein n=1 Tax=Aureliella helgolandensis TaxID=2527968 RepID=A0A518G4N2_9BACT|nr:hypothetical protein Q31a_18090 [Aureliella helgolandensis]
MVDQDRRTILADCWPFPIAVPLDLVPPIVTRSSGWGKRYQEKEGEEGQSVPQQRRVGLKSVRQEPQIGF